MPRKKNIDFTELQSYFHLPIQVVAKKLGVCATLLKKICRRNGITRWPHRKVKCLDKWLNALEENCQLTDEARMRDQIEDLKVQKNRLMKNPNSDVKISSNIKKRALALSTTPLSPVDAIEPGTADESQPRLRPLHRVRSAEVFNTSAAAAATAMRPLQRVRSENLSESAAATAVSTLMATEDSVDSMSSWQTEVCLPHKRWPPPAPVTIPSNSTFSFSPQWSGLGSGSESPRSLSRPPLPVLRPLQRVRSEDLGQIYSPHELEQQRRRSVTWSQPSIEPQLPSIADMVSSIHIRHPQTQPHPPHAISSFVSPSFGQGSPNPFMQARALRAHSFNSYTSAQTTDPTPHTKPAQITPSPLEMLMEVAVTERLNASGGITSNTAAYHHHC